MIRTAIAAAALMSAAASASAAPATQFYSGAAFGQADYRVDCTGATTCDDKVNAGKVYMGFNLNDAADGAVQSSIEASYFRGAQATVGDADVNVNARIQGLGLTYKAGLQLGAVELAARVGAAYTKSRVDVPGMMITEKASQFGATYGIGASMKLNEAWAVTLDADRVPAKYVDEKQAANLYSAGLRYSF